MSHSVVMSESTTSMPSSTVKSQVPITNCFLLSETQEDSRHHDRLASKHKLNALTIENLDKIEEYDLKDIAAIMGVNDKDSNEKLASNIIEKCLRFHDSAYARDYKYQTNAEPKIGGTPVSDLKECYISTNSNKGDVMVSYEGSHVLYVEVHSSCTYGCTIRKTVYLLMECLRMLKAFGVTQPKMHAFAFPRKKSQRCVVKLSMQYLPDSVRFQYSFKCLQLHEISSALTIAVQANKHACQNLAGEAQLDYILWLTAEERQIWGTNLYNAKSGFGVLLMNDETCLKRPIFTESFSMLHSIAELQAYGRRFPHMPVFNVAIPRVFIRYNKIRHQPLSYKEGRRCSRQLVMTITEVIQKIHTAGYMHRDLKLASICFDLNFDPILIGFDLCTIYIQNDVDADMEKFANELIECFENSQAAQGDLFIRNYAKGEYHTSLLEISVVNDGISSIRSVIIDRDVS